MVNTISYNDQRFAEHLDASKDPVWFVGRYLSDRGYSIRIDPTVWALHTEWKTARDNGDIYIWKPGWNNGESQRVEVKQLSAITAPEKFQFPSMMVCAAHSWDMAEPKPLAYMLINKERTYMAMVYSKDQPSWSTRIVPDKRYEGDYKQTMYLCPLEYVYWVAL